MVDEGSIRRLYATFLVIKHFDFTQSLVSWLFMHTNQRADDIDARAYLEWLIETGYLELIDCSEKFRPPANLGAIKWR